MRPSLAWLSSVVIAAAFPAGRTTATDTASASASAASDRNALQVGADVRDVVDERT
jgi:hypothetical protein